MKWKKAITAPKDETFVIFRDHANIYLGKRHQKQWLDKDDGIISEGIDYWTDEIPSPPLFINGKVMNGETYGWEILKAPVENEYVLAADELRQLHIAKFSCGWTDRKGNVLENIVCSFPLPAIKGNPIQPAD